MRTIVVLPLVKNTKPLFFSTTARVYQSYHGGDLCMRWGRDRKPEPTPLLTQGIFHLPHHIGMVWEELAFDNTVSYTQRGNEKPAKWKVIPGFRIAILRVTNPALLPTDLTPHPPTFVGGLIWYKPHWFSIDNTLNLHDQCRNIYIYTV